MENELPKTETAADGVEEKKEAGVGAEAVVVRSFFSERMCAMKDCVSKMSGTTKSFIIVLAVFALFLGVLYSYKGVFVVATVNGSPISRLSVVNELEKKAGKNILDTMITKKLIENETKKAGIVVKSEDIDAEMKKIEAQVTAQGGTLEAALEAQGMTADELREQIVINKELEQILADKIAVSDDEVNQYLSANKTAVPTGTNSDDMKAQVREQLKGQKFNVKAEKWVTDLRESAKIDYFVQY